MALTVLKRSKLRRFYSAVERIPVATIISVLFAMPVIAVAVMSPRQSYAIGVRDWRSRLHAVGSDRRGLVFAFSDVPFAPEHRLTADATVIPAGQFKEIRDWLFESGFLRGRRLGFWFASGRFPASPSLSGRFAALLVPYWVLIGLPLLPPLFLFRRGLIRRKRKGRGQCSVCGYDLRHSSGRCPECGVGKGDETPLEAATQGVPRAKLFLIVLLLGGPMTLALMLAGGSATRMPPPIDPQIVIPQGAAVSVQLDHVSRRSAVEAVARRAGIGIDVAWETFAREYPTELESVRLHNASAQQVLDAIRVLMPGASIRGGTTGSQKIFFRARSKPFIHVYPVADLLAQTGETAEELSGQFQIKPSYPRLELASFIDGAMRAEDPLEDGQIVTLIGSKLVVAGSEVRDEGVRRLLRNLREKQNAPLASDDQGRVEILRQDAPHEIERKIRDGLSNEKRNVVVDWQSITGNGSQKNELVATTTRHEVTCFGPYYAGAQLAGSARRYEVGDLIERAVVFGGKVQAPTGDLLGTPPAQGEDQLRVRQGDAILWLVEDLIDADQWEENGGFIGTGLRFTPNSIVIRTTGRTHHSIEQLLEAIRRAFSTGAVCDAGTETVSADHMGGAGEPEVVTKVYDIRPLVDAVVRYQSSSTPKPVATQPFPLSNAIGGLYGDKVKSAEIDDAVDTLTAALERDISPDSWVDNGGSVGKLCEFGGLLVIRQTPRNHRDIGRMLIELSDPEKLRSFLRAQNQEPAIQSTEERH